MVQNEFIDLFSSVFVLRCNWTDASQSVRRGRDPRLIKWQTAGTARFQPSQGPSWTAQPRDPLQQRHFSK